MESPAWLHPTTTTIGSEMETQKLTWSCFPGMRPLGAKMKTA